jgi:hypothetical protein
VLRSGRTVLLAALERALKASLELTVHSQQTFARPDAVLLVTRLRFCGLAVAVGMAPPTGAVGVRHREPPTMRSWNSEGRHPTPVGGELARNGA